MGTPLRQPIKAKQAVTSHPVRHRRWKTRRWQHHRAPALRARRAYNKEDDGECQQVLVPTLLFCNSNCFPDSFDYALSVPKVPSCTPLPQSSRRRCIRHVVQNGRSRYCPRPSWCTGAVVHNCFGPHRIPYVVSCALLFFLLTCAVVDAYTNPWGSWSPHSLNFMLFTSVWTLLAVAYLVLSPTRFPRAAHKYAIGAVEFLTMLFWFAAFIAVAVLWGDIVWGSRRGTFYGCGVAAIVFSAFLWYV